MNLDFPNIEVSSGSGEVYPEGVYRVNVTKFEETKASTGTEQIRWYATIKDGPYKGKTIIDHCALTDAAAWRIAGFIHNAGFNLKSMPKLNTNSESFKKVLRSCVGREMYWYVIEDNYNGKQNNKISEYKRTEEWDGIDGDVISFEEIPDFLKD